MDTDPDLLRQRRDDIRRRTEAWLLDLMLANGAGRILTPAEHVCLLEARAEIEALSRQLEWAALS